MAYVPVPKDLSKIKTKLAFNLTKRQLVCFSSAMLARSNKGGVPKWPMCQYQKTFPKSRQSWPST
ncbi:PrgI family protein [Gemmiger formicilis]|uniref:PrgI family protein n=1 Tax=Gemmiger formicilis TaxID=745368 RepID=UPI003CF03B36